MAETHGRPRSGRGEDGERRRFLFASTPAAGHLNPALPIAQELVARGHEVRWYSGREYQAAVEAIGARFEPLREAHDPADQAIRDRFPALDDLDGLAGFKYALKYLFLDEVPLQVADARRILAEFPADAVVADTGFFAAGPLHELGGPPWATYNITALPIASRDTAPFGTGKLPATNLAAQVRNRVLTLLTDRVVFRDVTRHQDGVRASLGLPPTPAGVLGTITPYLYLHPSTPAFEYPRRDLPEQVHFVARCCRRRPPASRRRRGGAASTRASRWCSSTRAPSPTTPATSSRPRSRPWRVKTCSSSPPPAGRPRRRRASTCRPMPSSSRSCRSRRCSPGSTPW